MKRRPEAFDPKAALESLRMIIGLNASALDESTLKDLRGCLESGEQTFQALAGQRDWIGHDPNEDYFTRRTKEAYEMFTASISRLEKRFEVVRSQTQASGIGAVDHLARAVAMVHEALHEEFEQL